MLKKVHLKYVHGLIVITCFIVNAYLLYHLKLRYLPVQLKQSIFTFEYKDEIPNSYTYYLKGNFNRKGKIEEEIIASMKNVGTYKLSFVVNEVSYPFEIQIIDTTAPEIVFLDGEVYELYKEDDMHWKSKQIQILEDHGYDYEITLKNEPGNDLTSICVNAKDEFSNTSHQCVEKKVVLHDKNPIKEKNILELETIISNFVEEYQLQQTQFSMFYFDGSLQKEFVYNGSQTFYGASTIKVPLAMIYMDEILQGVRSIEDKYIYLANDFENGSSYLASQYRVNESIPLQYLLEQSLQYSDNIATNILIRELGGFVSFHNKMKQYFRAKEPQYFDTINVVNANMMLDIMKHLYAHQERYQMIIDFMKKANENSYLKAGIQGCEIAQKYGMYYDNLHVIGIVYAKQPFLIGIFTDQRKDAQNLMIELSKRVYEFQNRN